jgi:hypothetical protein
MYPIENFMVIGNFNHSFIGNVILELGVVSSLESNIVTKECTPTNQSLKEVSLCKKGRTQSPNVIQLNNFLVQNFHRNCI